MFSHILQTVHAKIENLKLSGRMLARREKKSERDIDGQILENNKTRAELDERKRATEKR